MPNPFESGLLNLQLYDLRREPVLREARAWFLRDFNPSSLEELAQAVGSERNASFRMVVGYWELAASLVTTGAIDAEAFLAAHGEIYATFSKIQPFLDEMRKASGQSAFCKYMETVVMSDPNAPAILTRRREAIIAATRAASSG